VNFEVNIYFINHISVFLVLRSTVTLIQPRCRCAFGYDNVSTIFDPARGKRRGEGVWSMGETERERGRRISNKDLLLCQLADTKGMFGLSSEATKSSVGGCSEFICLQHSAGSVSTKGFLRESLVFGTWDPLEIEVFFFVLEKY